jgi:hypothetical protein
MKHLHYSRDRVPGASRGGGEGGQKRGARYNWRVGSRDTVGRRSMELLVKEVMPRFEDLVPK